jgi:glyoxylase-like metal-dependent hydrolase (beta-lactamase superfamily II)
MEAQMNKELIFALVLTAMAGGAFASENSGVYSVKVGQLEVYMLVDGERDGNASILPDADEADLKRYIPAAGFKHSTNAFLIKAPGQNILVDTGFGTNVFEKMEKLGVELEQVDAVLITHLHGDHIGGLQEKGAPLLPNAKIYLDAKEYEHFTKTQVNQGAVNALAPYGSNVITFEAAALGEKPKEIFSGIGAIANYGHTPGHTVYLLENGGEKLIIAGDYLHIALIQFPLPDISASYDMDRKAAAASRRQILEYAANNKIPIGGMHVVYPGIGNVEAEGEGYKFIPLN